MVERLFILAAVALLVLAVWGGVRAWRALRVRQLAHETPLAGLVPSGRPAVVSFSTPSCAECRTRQLPALTRLGAELGEQITVQKLSALEHAALVEQLGVLTVPATVVLDATGVVQHLNLGYTDERRLAAQLQPLLGKAGQ